MVEEKNEQATVADVGAEKSNPLADFFKLVALGPAIAEEVAKATVAIKEFAVSDEGTAFRRAWRNKLIGKGHPLLAGLVDGLDTLALTLEQTAEEYLKKDLDSDGKVGG